MMAWLRSVFHIRGRAEALQDVQHEPVVEHAIKGLRRIDRLTGSHHVDRILVELEAIEGKRR